MKSSGAKKRIRQAQKEKKKSKAVTPDVSIQIYRAYNKLSCIHRADNLAKKLLPKSPKGSVVVKRLLTEFKDGNNSRDISQASSSPSKLEPNSEKGLKDVFV